MATTTSVKERFIGFLFFWISVVVLGSVAALLTHQTSCQVRSTPQSSKPDPPSPTAKRPGVQPRAGCGSPAIVIQFVDGSDSVRDQGQALRDALAELRHAFAGHRSTAGYVRFIGGIENDFALAGPFSKICGGNDPLPDPKWFDENVAPRVTARLQALRAMGTFRHYTHLVEAIGELPRMLNEAEHLLATDEPTERLVTIRSDFHPMPRRRDMVQTIARLPLKDVQVTAVLLPTRGADLPVPVGELSLAFASAGAHIQFRW